MTFERPLSPEARAEIFERYLGQDELRCYRLDSGHDLILAQLKDGTRMLAVMHIPNRTLNLSRFSAENSPQIIAETEEGAMSSDLSADQALKRIHLSTLADPEQSKQILAAYYLFEGILQLPPLEEVLGKTRTDIAKSAITLIPTTEERDTFLSLCIGQTLQVQKGTSLEWQAGSLEVTVFVKVPDPLDKDESRPEPLNSFYLIFLRSRGGQTDYYESKDISIALEDSEGNIIMPDHERLSFALAFVGVHEGETYTIVHVPSDSQS